MAAPTLEKIVVEIADPAEPALDAKEIQGNVLVGFLKDHQRLIFMQITDADGFKAKLKGFVGHIATLKEVHAFAKLFSRMKKRRGNDESGLRATWINIAFSHDALQTLLVKDLEEFSDEAF